MLNALKDYLARGTLAERVVEYDAVQKAVQVVMDRLKSAISEYVTTQNKTLFEKRIIELEPLTKKLEEIKTYTIAQAKRFLELMDG